MMSRMILGLSGLAGAVVGVPILAYLLSPLLNPAPNRWVNATVKGQPVPASSVRVGETTEVEIVDPSPLPWAGQTATTAAWLRRTGETSFTAFSVNCTHLGCPVNWLADARLFLCPCHGGVYYADGRVAGGPPPHPLFQYDVRVQDGTVQILTRPLQLG
jgi:menaquinol-cytochrome c reductase iron-sulfur subunit